MLAVPPLLQRRSSRGIVVLPTLATPPPPPPPPLTPSLLHGLLPTRSLPVAHPPLRQVLPVPSPDLTLTIDSACARAYRAARISAHVGFKVDDPGADGAVLAGREVADVVGWGWSKARRCVVGVTKTMCFKTFDTFLRPLSSVPLPSPALHVTPVDAANEFIVGGVGSLSIWGWGDGEWSTSPNQPLVARLQITDLAQEEWCTTSMFCPGGMSAFAKHPAGLVAAAAGKLEEEHRETRSEYQGRLFVGVGGDIIVYAYDSGSRIERYSNIFEGSVTCLAWYEPYGYLCVGGVEGRIKVLDPLRHAVHTIMGHAGGVTSLAVPYPDHTPKIPILMSGGKDGVLRCWSLETGREVY
ncbi:WD repeat-containing protein 87, partial [Gonapodya sp. JEL0774]